MRIFEKIEKRLFVKVDRNTGVVKKQKGKREKAVKKKKSKQFAKEE